jgi:hypothetical protein
MSNIPYNLNIGKCIYCGTDQGKLTDEHVVPFALGGRFVLRKASCEACQKVTSRFEFDVLRGPLLTSRLTLGMPTRNKKTRPTEIRYPDLFDADGEKIDLTNDGTPRLFIALEFALPAFFDKQPIDKGIRVTGYRTLQISGPKINGLFGTGISSIQFSESYPAVSYARLIAKIAHGFATAAFGLDNFEELYLPDAILGKTDEIGKWVGCLHPPQMGKSHGTYKVSFAHNGPFVCAIVKLFASWETPEYLVVVGQLRERYQPPSDISANSDRTSRQFVIDPNFREEPGTTYYGDLTDPELNLSSSLEETTSNREGDASQ